MVSQDQTMESPSRPSVINLFTVDVGVNLEIKRKNPRVAVFDLDGTLTDTSHRQHYLEQYPKDWQAFFNACDKDAPQKTVLNTLLLYSQAGYDIWIVSGRSDEVKNLTMQWLHEHLHFRDFPVLFKSNVTLVMRPEGDYRPDHELKREWLNEGVLPSKDRIEVVYDDRDKVVAMWREQGFPCFQVAEGNF